MFFPTTIIDTKWSCGNRPLTKIKETRRFNGMTCIGDIHCKYHDEENTRKEREKKKDETLLWEEKDGSEEENG